MSPVQAAARRLAAPLAPKPSSRPQGGAHLKVVDQPKASPRQFARRGTVISVLVFVGLLALAASHAMLVQGQVTLDALDEAVAAQQAEYQLARLEVARLEAPERVVNEAIIRLGMVEPTDVVYLTPSVAQTDVDPRNTDDIDDSWRSMKPYLERSS